MQAFCCKMADICYNVEKKKGVSKMAYKRILTIQDISCVGQCSMTVAMPILSACGHETCVLPTAILSTHTGGFGKPVVVHFEEALPDIWHHWERCGIRFDAILVGYLGSIPAIEAAKNLMDTLLVPGGVKIVDPAMGDNGKLYAGFDDAYVGKMRELCGKADIILPNMTEAGLLSGNPYREKADHCYVNKLLDDLEEPRVILTGVGFSDSQTGVAWKEDAERQYFSHERVGHNYHGTGDIFAACFTGSLLQGCSMADSIRISADFTKKSIENTVKCSNHWYGVRFETVLPELMARLGL